MLIKYNNFMLFRTKKISYNIINFTENNLNKYGSCLLKYDRFSRENTVALNKYYGLVFNTGILADYYQLYKQNQYIGINFTRIEFRDNIRCCLIKHKYKLSSIFGKN